MGDFDLTGRVAIITGGNSGIGLGMADALARAGCAISIWGRAKLLKPRSVQPLLSLDGLTPVSPMPESAAGDGKALSTAPRRSGGACSPSTSIACSACFNLLPAT